MLLKESFTDTIARLGLEEDTMSLERDLAELVWRRCEAAFLNKSPQTATLLKKPIVADLDEKVLTRSEIQFLTAFLADVFTMHAVAVKDLNQELQQTWLLCDPDDESTKENFKQLNQLRNLKRKSKYQLAKLNKIQRKLKKLR